MLAISPKHYYLEAVQCSIAAHKFEIQNEVFELRGGN